MDLRDLFGIEHPIIRAPMAGAQNHLLAAAVCEAGGLGSIRPACSMRQRWTPS